MLEFMFRFIKVLYAPNCPNCDSSNTKEVISIFGNKKYKCIDCTHTWVE